MSNHPKTSRHRVRECFARNRLALNTYVGFSDPALVEILGIAGFDAVTIDLEHMAFDMAIVRQLIVAAESAGISPIVRVAPDALATCLPMLDFGAQGIQVTHVRDSSVAERAVRCVRYPPVGRRGALGISRAARYGAIGWTEHVAAANRDLLIIAMIEDEEALEHVEAIASVPGIDLVTVGAHDLAESLGIRSPGDAALRSAVMDVARRVQKAGKARMGFSLAHPVLDLSLKELRELGVAYVNVLPPPEVRLRVALTTLVSQIREEEKRLAT